MPKLIIKKGDFVVNKISIPKDVLAFTVGSEQGNDVIIKDETISYYHVQFERQNEEYYVRDLQSQSGTFINNTRISARTILNNEDEVRIGNHTICFKYNETENGPSTRNDNYQGENRQSNSNLKDKIAGVPSLSQLNSWLKETHEEHDVFIDNSKNGVHAPFNGFNDNEHQSNDFFDDNDDEPGPLTTLINSGVETLEKPKLELETNTLLQPEKTESPDLELTETFFSEEKPTPKRETKIRHYLIGIYGYYLGRKFKLRRSRTRIGRERKHNHIILNRRGKGRKERGVSRRHLTISFKKNDYYLQDRKSKCGTWVNDKKIPPDSKVKLQPGDEIEIASDKGSHIFRFVSEGDWNFSPPKKAGVWHVKHRLMLKTILSLMLVIVAGYMFNRSLGSSPLFKGNTEFHAEEMFWAGGSAIPGLGEFRDLNFRNYSAIADLNNDNFIDLVFIDNSGHIRCIDGDSKRPLWINRRVQASPRPFGLHDVNQDRLPEVIVVSEDSRLYVLDARNGNELLISQVLKGPLSGAPVVDDFNGDGFSDFALVSEHGSIYLGFSGTETARWETIESEEQIHSYAAAEDMTNDGIPDIVIGTESGQILIVDATIPKILGVIDVGEELSKASGTLTASAHLRLPVSFGDLTGDGTKDLVICTHDGSVIALNGRTLERLWWNEGDEAIDSTKVITPSIALADFDDDQLADVAILSRSGRIQVIAGKTLTKDQKSLIWEFPIVDSGNFIGPPAIADFNLDGLADIVVANRAGQLHIFDGASGRILWKNNSNMKAIISPPLIADLDNNEFLDVLIQRADGDFFKIASKTHTDTKGPQWGQIFGNNRYTSLFSDEQTVGPNHALMMALSLLIVFSVMGSNLVLHIRRKKLINEG